MRTRFPAQSLVVATGLVVFGYAFSLIAGLEDSLSAIIFAAAVSLLCFVPTYYVLRWVFARSPNLMAMALVAGLPLRFGIALFSLAVAHQVGIIDSVKAAFWLSVFYIALLIVENMSLYRENALTSRSALTRTKEESVGR